MLTVDQALATMLAHASPLPAERVLLEAAFDRVLAADLIAAIDQPPFRAAAMDGYAARFDDAKEGASLRVVGESAAGRPFEGAIHSGEAVRIFTGAVMPGGAAHIVIQEEARAEGDRLIVAAKQRKPQHVREPGIDFKSGSVIKRRGARLGAVDLALIASANFAEVEVRWRPVVAFFDNGDELVEPGAALKTGEIVGSIRFAMQELIAAWGAAPSYLGRAGDDRRALAAKFDAGRNADLIIAIGGASVGDHDHMRDAFADAGGELLFAKVSVKPGKPTWFGRLGVTRVLGLPGNPASAIVCSMLFLRPLIARLSGEERASRLIKAALASPLEANGPRESFLRGTLHVDGAARTSATPFENQDSSLLSPLAAGNCLIRRIANAPALDAGAVVDCLLCGSLEGRDL